MGFDVEQPDGDRGRGLGLIGMRERASLVRGTVVIESRPWHGPTVFARVPLAPVRRSGP